MASHTVEGVIQNITFYSETTGYTVAQLKDDTGNAFPVVGTMPVVHEGERVRITGSWRDHPRYGRQFHAEYVESLPLATEEAIRRYLASGFIHGVGPKTAERIVERFGRNTMKVITDKPERLTEVPGIGRKKAAAIQKAATQQEDMREAILFLQQFDISPSMAMRIFRHYKEKTISYIKENPYRLADDIHGIGFQRADEIARALGIETHSLVRAQAALRHVLRRASQEGHTFLPAHIARERFQQMDVPDNVLESCVDHLQKQRRLVTEQRDGEMHLYLPVLYDAEVGVASHLQRLATQVISSPQLEDKDTLFNEGPSMRLTSEQRQAVDKALEAGCLVITGGPGTGKTTVVRALQHMFDRFGMRTRLAAPTGRAAQRLSEATGEPASTIHRLLEVRHTDTGTGLPVFNRNRYRPLEADVVIVDELSMIDIVLMHNLLEAIALGTRLILIGDEDQLASVGPGQVLADMLQANSVPVIRLTKVFRQAAGSLIVENAHRIKNGTVPITKGQDSDFFFMECALERIADLVEQLVAERLPRFLQMNPIEDIQVLAPVRRGPVGVNQLNERLQQRLNNDSGPYVTVGERVFRQNDKVMQTENDYDRNVFNGDIGRIVRIDAPSRRCIVAYPDNDGERHVEYDEQAIRRLEHAYAISVHKSQGSEYPCVVVPITYIMPALMTRRLLYTALTRGQRLVVFVGLRQALGAYVNNESGTQRFSSLAYRLQVAM